MGDEKNCPDGPRVEVVVQDKEMGRWARKGKRVERRDTESAERKMQDRQLANREVGVPREKKGFQDMSALTGCTWRSISETFPDRLVTSRS